MQNIKIGYSQSQDFYIRFAQQNDIPLHHVKTYILLLNKLIGYYKDLIHDIIQSSGGQINLPMNAKYIEDYLSGFNFLYFTCNDVDGRWEFSKDDISTIFVFYNQSHCPERQRYSQIHELMHLMQFLDMRFVNFFNTLVYETDLPDKVIGKLLERATNKAVSIYLMPNGYIRKHYEEVKMVEDDVNVIIPKLADLFYVSKQSLEYRLKDMKII